MKKIVLTAAFVLASLAAMANFQTTSLVSFHNAYYFPEDTTQVTPQAINEQDTVLTRVAFYNIDHLTITNNSNNYIRVENSRCEVVAESFDSIDINLPEGNYYVYSSSARLIAKFR